MSCNSGKCNCGSSCSCGSDCKCGAYPDIEISTAATVVIDGVAPKMAYSEGSENEGGNACKCGANCKCDPCNC